ncbi:hypothetical protein WI23_26770 [Burkholderia oklahomensis C6786]|nr:hypothetical protein WI23_26770 [Burkholderia oklahomensis C6786]KUY62344.1 hypothetical protein WI23_09840 [Burkholderia oklahomensis C6786]
MRVTAGESQRCMTLRRIGGRHRAGRARAAARPRIAVDAFVERTTIGPRLACACDARSSGAAQPVMMRLIGHPK